MLVAWLSASSEDSELLLSGVTHRKPPPMEKFWLCMTGIYIDLILHPDHKDDSFSLAFQNILTKTLRHCSASGNVHSRTFGPSLEMMPCDSDSPMRNDSKTVEHPPNIVVQLSSDPQDELAEACACGDNACCARQYLAGSDSRTVRVPCRYFRNEQEVHETSRAKTLV